MFCNKINVCVEAGGIIPNRVHDFDYGLDFYAPEGFEGVIMPQGNLVIDTKVRVEIPRYTVGLFSNRSSVASQKNLILGAEIIDHEYTGTLKVDLHNVGMFPVQVKGGEKICQLGILPCLTNFELVKQTVDYFNTIKSERGEKGFGSSDCSEGGCKI